MSYSTHNADIVRDVARKLQQRGIEVYLDDFDRDMAGKPFLQVLEESLRRATTVAVFIGAGGLGRFQRLEVNLAVILSAQRGLRVVPVLLPGADHVSELELFLQCFSWIDFRAGLVDKQLENLVHVCRSGVTATPAAANAGALTLPDLLKKATKRLIIFGHTLDKFTRDEGVREALVNLALQDRRITILQLNPESPYADAHRPFHVLESRSSADDQYEHSLSFFRSILEVIAPAKRDLLDVSFTQYMPRFRTVVVDDAVYVYLYMYGGDVTDRPDLCLEPSDTPADLIRQRILYSTLSAVHAPESLPYIRCSQVFSRWRETRIATWTKWTEEERARHKLTHEFYVTHAHVFHARYGQLLEADVQAHLDHTTGDTLVLGCGSGKEVEYLSQRRPRDYVCGIDFSHVAVAMARQRCNTRDRIGLGDFYDLEVSEFLKGRSFGSVVVNAAFVHLPNREDINELLLKVRKRLTVGGVMFLRCLFKENSGQALTEETEESDSDGWTDRRWFVYYSRTELVRRCQEAGFEVEQRATENIVKSIGLRSRPALEKGIRHMRHKDVFWSCVLARKLV
jgi:methylase of polypeptide subunit release factors